MDKINIHLVMAFLIVTLFATCNDDQKVEPMELVQVFAGNTEIDFRTNSSTNIPLDNSLTLVFSNNIKESSVEGAVELGSSEGLVDIVVSLTSENTITIRPKGLLKSNTVYTVGIQESLRTKENKPIDPFSFSFQTKLEDMELTSVKIDDREIGTEALIIGVEPDFSMNFTFSSDVSAEMFEETFSISNVSSPDFSLSQDQRTISVSKASDLEPLQKYELQITDSFTGVNGEPFNGYSKTFYTKFDSTAKFPEITDEALLTKVQEQTFKYFWDFGHPTSGLARERNTSGETVTSGGSGFGLMSIVVGMERGFITREEGVNRLDKIITFLGEKADRFHGAWPHWLNGTTGEVIPFSSNDDGGDLVETAFVVQGLLTVRQYLDPANTQEATIIAMINQLWEAVEWDWYTQGGQNVLYWHWSPNFGWEKNHRITGWNEASIVYVLAASSTTHGIDAEVYTEGWARSGAMVNTNNNSYYGYTLDLRSDRGGPLFFSHYSFLGLDPRNLSDQYANYWQQNVNHTLINQAYCIQNPKNYVGYAPYSWGLTASDNHQGYNAHSPDNDLGVITPTAAISAIPYTPEASMNAIRHFYYILGDRLWGPHGFYDAFNFTEDWVASSYLAIDQGPIIVMIENHRTGLLWDLFMSAPEIQNGLDKLGFTYE